MFSWLQPFDGWFIIICHETIWENKIISTDPVLYFYSMFIKGLEVFKVGENLNLGIAACDKHGAAAVAAAGEGFMFGG